MKAEHGPVRYLECLVPISNCNLKCSYCYVIQQNRRNKNVDTFKLNPIEIGKALAPERWGGVMMINLCGFGETLIPREMPELIFEILKQGHYVNVTNNGTMSKRFQQIIEMPLELLRHLSFSFSLHYCELKKRGLLESFANNVKLVREAGCSTLIQLNMCDEYIEIEDEIKEYCLKHFGALPQVALTRREIKGKYEIFTDKDLKSYIKHAQSYNSPLFDFTYQNFNLKQKKFCYAGDWSFKLNIGNGELRSCYFSKPFCNIYDNMEKKIEFSPVGWNCGCKYCINSSHFLSLGVIPELKSPTYVELRNRKEADWYSEEMMEFLNHKFIECHEEYGMLEKIILSTRFFINSNVKKIATVLPSSRKRI